MRPDEPPEDDRPVGLARSIRFSFAAYVDEIVLFLLPNVGLVIVAAGVIGLAAAVPAAVVLTPVLSLPIAVSCRLAVAAARGGSPRWAMVGQELPRRAGRKLAIAALQLFLLGIGLLNLALAGHIGGVPGVLSLVISGYVVLASSVYAVALWPIVCDPRREGPLAEQLRLALAVVMLRPFQVGTLAILAALGLIASIQLIAPAVILPSLIVLASTHYVVNVADRLRPTVRR
ncbi:MAG: hypothetical protein M3406_13830 [Chloroflexota bacterium]|nr:hypothetical protein [Chloroflexota bacterium]